MKSFKTIQYLIHGRKWQLHFDPEEYSERAKDDYPTVLDIILGIIAIIELVSFYVMNALHPHINF